VLAAGVAKLELAGRVVTGATPLAEGEAKRAALATADAVDAGNTTTSGDDAVISEALAALAGSATSAGNTCNGGATSTTGSSLGCI
jgi:hypothetical protein